MSQQCHLGLHVSLHFLLTCFLLSSCSDEQQQARIVRDQNFIVYEKKSELPACAGSLVGKVVFIEETRETMRCDASGFTVISGELASQSGPGGDPSDQPSDTPPERNTLSVQGRVMASLYDDSDTTGAGEPLTPVAGLPVYVWIDGTKLVSLTDTDGYYRFSGVPAVPSANDSAENSVVIYFDPVTSGYVIAPNLTSSTQQTVLAEISVAANQDFPEQMKYQVDAGVSRVFEYGLYFDPGLGRVAAPDGNDWDVGSSGRWLQGAPGATSTFYLADAADSIPISFTLPVDRDYAGTDFVHLLDPDGKLVPSTGTWNDQGTLFTLDPQNDLVGSENDESMYRLVFNKGIRAFSPITGRLYELAAASGQHFDIPFWVRGAALERLATQAPTLSPQYAATSDLAYTFDAEKACVSALSPGTRHTTRSCAANKTIVMSWNDIAAANSFRLYCRNSRNNRAGNWVDVTAQFTVTRTAGGRWVASGAANNWLYTTAAGRCDNDARLSGGEKVELIVTALDADGNESLRTLASPLEIADTVTPQVAAITSSAATPQQSIPELLQPNFTVHRQLNLSFSEAMDGVTPEAKPVLTEISGLFSAASVLANGSSGDSLYSEVWTSDRAWRAVVQTTFNASATTFSRAAAVGESLIAVADTQAFRVGDQVALYTALSTATDFEVATVADLDTAARTILLTSALTRSHPSGSSSHVRLLKSALNFSYFVATLTAESAAQSLTVSAADAARFLGLHGQTLYVYIPDRAGFQKVTAGTIQSVNTTTGVITFTGPLSRHFPAGSVASLADLTASTEPAHRGTSTLTLAEEVEFESRTVPAMSVAIDDEASPNPDAFLLLSDTSGLRIGDWLRIDNTQTRNVSTSQLLNGLSPGSSSLQTQAAHAFLPGDVVRIAGAAVNLSNGGRTNPGDADVNLTAAADLLAGEQVSYRDPEFRTTLTADEPNAETTLAVTSTAGFAIGQTVLLEDGNGGGTGPFTIQAVGANTITLTAGISRAFGAGTQVRRAEINSSFTLGANLATGNKPPMPGAPIGVSQLATYSVSRPDEFCRVTAVVDTTTVSVSCSGANTAFGHAASAQVALVSGPEYAKVAAITGSEVQFSASLRYVHRQGDTVSLAETAVATFNAGQLDAAVKGDQLLIGWDDGVSSFVEETMYRAQILDLDTATARATLASPLDASARPTTGLNLNGLMRIELLGDAFLISGARDSSGNSVLGNKGLILNMGSNNVQ